MLTYQRCHAGNALPTLPAADHTLAALERCIVQIDWIFA
jgi:hypothetical protein